MAGLEDVRLLSNEMVANVQDVFAFFDSTRRGTLNERQAQQALAALGLPQHSVPTCPVSAVAFVLYVDRCIERQDDEQRLRQLFAMLDTKHRGWFDAADVRRFLTLVQDRVPSQDLMLDLCDLIGSGDGTVAFPDFARHIRTGIS